jgi:TetR/AcrR family transcriptional repressor of bet genes
VQLSHERSVTKLEERRAELARSALTTLARRGFAHTSLRDIAKDSPYSHGVLHYYFSDKSELVAHCLTMFSEHRSEFLAELNHADLTAEDFRAAMARTVAQGVRDNTSGYVVWYDLRSQPGVDDTVAATIRRIDQERRFGAHLATKRHAELADAEVVYSAETSYALSDGLIQHAVRRYDGGDTEAPVWLEAEIARFLEVSIGGALSAPSAVDG